MPTYTYGLYPFTWTTEGASGYHAPPAGSACVLDLRNETQQATQGQSGGYGLFAWESSPPNDLISLGTGYAPTLQIDSAVRSELQTKLGLSGPPSGATLADAMASVLGELADPTGTSGPRPIMPGRDGTCELHLAGHSRIWSQRIDGDEVLSMSPKGRANRIREVIRAKLTAAESVGGRQLLQKVLAAELLKLGLTREEVAEGASGKATQWRRLLTTALRAKHGDARPERPTTSFAESWPTAAADLTGSAQDLTWTEMTVDGFADGLKVASNTLRATSSFTDRLGVCGSAVSSDDHWVEGYITGVGGGGSAFACARQAASRGTHYAAGFALAGARRLAKRVNGTLTVLATAGISAPTAVLVRVDCDGSTITGTWPSLSNQVATDTSIPSGLRGSAWLYIEGLDTYSQVGAWSIDDGLSGGGSGPFGVLGHVGIDVGIGVGFGG